MVVVASAGIWGYFAFLYTKPLSKAELAELTPDWDVVTHGNWSPWFDLGDGTTEWNPAASFNAWLATVPEDDKAWPKMIELFYPYPDVVLGSDYLGTIPHDAPQWEELLKVIGNDRSDVILAQLKIALARPVMGVALLNSTDPYEHQLILDSGLEDIHWDTTPIPNLDMFSALLPTLGRHRGVANFLSSRAAYELENGNVDEFIAIMDLTIHSSSLSLEVPTLIGHLVQVAIVAKAFDTIDWAISTRADSFNDAQLTQLDVLIAKHTKLPFNWQGEAMVFHDTMRRLSNEDGKISFSSMAAWSNSGGFDSNTQIPCSLTELQLDKSIQRPLAIYNHALKLTSDTGQLPWDEKSMTSGQYLEGQLSTIALTTRLMLNILVPSLEQVSKTARVFEQEAIALRLAIALERHHLRHASYPSALDDLDPDLLAFDPIDAFTGGPLKYILRDGKPLIYSVSDDRDDDQGAPMYEYDIDELLNPSKPTNNRMTNQLNIFKKTVFDTRVRPMWITLDRVNQIAQVEPNAVDGDWVLYPTPRDEPEPIEEDDDWDLEPVPQEDD